MTSDLCEDVRMTSPQILTIDGGLVDDADMEELPLAGGGTGGSEHVGGAGGAGSGGAGAGAGGAARVQASSAAVELGRRLLLAARAGDTQTVLDLMAKGAPFTTDWLGTSPLHLAAANAHADTCAVLLRAGVSRDSRTKVERTPLHLAAHAGHAAVVALLLDHGAIVDCRDMLRMTPLHWAAARGHVQAAGELVRRGADVRARCKFRHSPRALARRHGHADLVALLDRAEAAALAEQMEEETRKTTLEIENLTKSPEIKIEKPKLKPQPETAKPSKPEPKVDQQQQAAQLLRRHGITLLPTDDGSTVLNAIQSGRTVVLSDAGKLMLKESGGAGGAAGGAGGAAGGAGGAGGGAGSAGGAGGGVVLTATPVRSPPRGVKVFTLNNKLLVPAPSPAIPAPSPAAPAPANKTPVKKIINPHELQQMKFVQLSSEGGAGKGRARARGGGGGGGRPAVKIIVNKSNLSRLLAAAPLTTLQQAPATDAAAENKRLRAQLAAAQQALADCAAELRTLRARLAHYEAGDQ